MRISASLCLIAAILSGACRSERDAPANLQTSGETSITISAAISLKDAFNEIGRVYTTKTGRPVAFNFGASGALQQQIEAGAPADVFASAGEKQMNEVAAKGLIDIDSRRDFAGNRLVLIVPTDSKIDLADFSFLARPDIEKIAVGNPKTVPAGEYTEQFLQTTGLKDRLNPKLILAENVRQVLDYVVRGEVDAGFVYSSDALIAADSVHVAATVPETNHAPIRYPIAVVKDSKHVAAAREFLDLVLQPEGQAILRKYGFTTAVEN